MKRKIKKVQIVSDNDVLSCTPKTPLVDLPDTGNPPILNYNLPQSTCFDAAGITAIDIAPEYFKSLSSEGSLDTTFNYEDFFSDYNDWVEQIVNTTGQNPNEASFFIAFGTQFENFLSSRNYPTSELMGQINNNSRISLYQQFQSVALSFEAGRNNLVPEFHINLSGDVTLKTSELTTFEPQPQLFIVEHYKICSYIGDYGAGKVLKTLSLLPGERTTISIRTFKQRTETRTKSENILDSFSTSSASELESILEIENNENSSSSFGSKETIANSKTVDKSLSASLSAGTGTKANVGGSLGSSTTNSSGRETTINKSREKNVNILNSSISKQTSTADAFREVEVNVESTVSTISETEVTTVREIENINKSRVLNFTFRQLLQGYKTFTYLDRVSVAFTTGDPNVLLLEDLGTCRGLLEEILEGTNPNGDRVTDTLFAQLLKNYCNVLDYNKDTQQFYEEVNEQLVDCFFGGDTENFTYYRKKRKHFENENEANPEVGYRLPGIVVSIENRIFRTDSVIVDALLGHGEALDCFNLELQDATVTKAHLDNIGIAQEQRKFNEAIEALNAVSDPELKAKLYETLFKECCSEKIIIRDINDIE
ncbi:MAG: hypothetical protein AAGG68_16860 [Bacteroidota bacterium]